MKIVILPWNIIGIFPFNGHTINIYNQQTDVERFEINARGKKQIVCDFIVL